MLNVWYLFTTYIYPLQKLPRFVGIYTRPMEHRIIASSAAEVQNNERHRNGEKIHRRKPQHVICVSLQNMWVFPKIGENPKMDGL